MQRQLEITCLLEQSVMACTKYFRSSKMLATTNWKSGKVMWCLALNFVIWATRPEWEKEKKKKKNLNITSCLITGIEVIYRNQAQHKRSSS